MSNLTTDDFSTLDNRYVTKEEYTLAQEKISDQIHELRKNYAVITTKLNLIVGILSAIGVAVLSVAVKMLFRM